MTSRRIVGIALTGLTLCAALAPMPAAAQGNGRGNAFGHNKKASSGAASAATSSSSGAAAVPEASASQPEGTGIRTFGSWLDDSSIMTPGMGFMSFSVGYWRMPSFTEIDAPAFDVGVGLTPRVQVGASVPVYHAAEPGGPTVRGIGDLFLTSKIQLRDAAQAKRAPLGVAITPIVEVLSAAPAGGGRVSWGVPASVEWRQPNWRAYGSTGYFSRGAVFASGALELTVGRRAWITGTISSSRSNADDPLSEAIGLTRVRTDVSGGASVAVSDALAAFGSIGRTISREDGNSSRLFVVGGLSVNFEAWHR